MDDDLRRRFAMAKQADRARNALIEDLFQQVNDLQKQMDRHGFVLVLIDGDCMNFLDELVWQGSSGGEKAARRLRKAVFDYLRYDEDFKHDYKIVIRVYANFRGLSRAHSDSAVPRSSSPLTDFALGFNNAHPLCDFIDAGDRKQAVDNKLKESLTLYTYNVHCKHIILGTSADNSYTSLSSSFSDTDLLSRLSMLKGAPSSPQSSHMMSNHRWTEFPTVFKSELLAANSLYKGTRTTWSNTFFASSTIPCQSKSTNHDKSNLAIMGDAPRFSSPLHWPKPESPRLNPPVATIDQSERSSPNDGQIPHLHENVPSNMISSETEDPTAADVVAALVSSVIQRLKISPLALDFSIVKTKAAQKLGVASTYWGTSDRYMWYSRSKDVIKWAVEDWIERTNSHPPKNATWLLRYFRVSRQPADIMMSPSSRLWRTPMDPEMPLLDLNSSQSSPQHSNPQSSGRRTPADWSAMPRSEVTPSKGIPQNRSGQRIDLPVELDINLRTVDDLKDHDPRLCNNHHLLHRCFRGQSCPYDHDTALNHGELNALHFLSRSYRCPQGPDCLDALCLRGHVCPSVKRCRRGAGCRFVDTHGIDTEVVRYASASNVRHVSGPEASDEDFM